MRKRRLLYASLLGLIIGILGTFAKFYNLSVIVLCISVWITVAEILLLQNDDKVSLYATGYMVLFISFCTFIFVCKKFEDLINPYILSSYKITGIILCLMIVGPIRFFRVKEK